jgi:hypothetical protein
VGRSILRAVPEPQPGKTSQRDTLQKTGELFTPPPRFRDSAARSAWFCPKNIIPALARELLYSLAVEMMPKSRNAAGVHGRDGSERGAIEPCSQRDKVPSKERVSPADTVLGTPRAKQGPFWRP